MPNTSQTIATTVGSVPPGVNFPAFTLGGGSGAVIRYQFDYSTENNGGVFPRYPMKIDFDFVDGEFIALKFVTSDGVVETITPPIQRSFTIRNGMEFSKGLVQASAQGGKYQGLYLIQAVDDAKYPVSQAFFNPEEINDWVSLSSDLWIELSPSWWNSLASGVGLGELVTTKQISITLTDGSGYRTKHTVYCQLWLPQPV